MKKHLFFFTAEFPYGKHETFIQNEIPFMATSFDSITVFPYNFSNELTRELPNNFEIKKINARAGKSILFKKIFLVFRMLFIEFRNTKSKWFFVRNIRTWLVMIQKAIGIADELNIILNEIKEDKKIYSYWMNEWTLALAILKSRGKIENFIFRCGGYDIWDERYQGNYLPFRFFTYKFANAVYPNSKIGETYLKKINYYPEKIECAYWGTHDGGINPKAVDETLILVSCASLIPLKRVDLIVKALKNCNRNIRWIHFGDGIQMPELVKTISELPHNINVHFAGNVKNSTIHEFYANNHVDFFITTSETESLPVSIQEAISYGIPVIATNVGGINEMVDNETGYLIEKDFDIKYLTQLINKVDLIKWRADEKRKTIRNSWRLKFEDNSVYSAFYKKL